MKRKADIAYIISHGFAARMLIQTDLLGKISRKGFSVAIITPDKNDTSLVSYAKEAGITIKEYNPAPGLWTGEYIRLRKYLFEDIRKNPALLEKHARDIDSAKKNSRARLFKIKSYYFIYSVIHTLPFLRSFFSIFEKWSLKDHKAKQVLKELDPNLVVATYPVNLAESRLLYAANKSQGIDTAIHLLSWDNITCKGFFPQLADQYISWGNIMKEEFIEYYKIPVSRIFNTGVPHFDLHIQVKGSLHYKELLMHKGLDPEKPYLFFAMSSPYFSPYEIDIVEWLAQAMNANRFGELQMVVRPHPQNMSGTMADSSWIGRLKNIGSAKVAVDWPKLVESNLNWSMQRDDMIDFAHLLEGCCISINSGSTVSIDSLLHGKPVLLTLFDAEKDLPWWKSVKRVESYRHCKKLIDLQGVSVVHSFDELSFEIHRYLEDPQYMFQKKQQALYEETGASDGKATDRVVSVIENMFRNKN